MKHDEDTLHRAHMSALEQVTASYGGVVARPDRVHWKPVTDARAQRERNADGSARDRRTLARNHDAHARNHDTLARDHDALAWTSPVEIPRVGFEGLLSPSYYIGEEVARLLGALFRRLAGVYDVLRGRYVRYQTYEALSRLDDRLLSDIGLRRDDLARVAREAELRSRGGAA